MNLKFLDSGGLIKSLSGSSEYLKLNYRILDNLNIFPVPDGDTGTNMLATFEAGIKALKTTENLQSIDQISRIMDESLQHESRGNSGFILSRFFHGFFAELKGQNEINARLISNGFTNGLFIVKTSL